MNKINTFFRYIRIRRDLTVVLLILPMISVLLMELVHRKNMLAVYQWIRNDTGEFFLNYLIVAGLITLAVMASKKIHIPYFIVNSFLLLVSLISTIKMKYLGEPLVAWDLVLGKETANILTHFSNLLSFKLVISIVIYLIIGYYVFSRLSEPKYLFKQRTVERLVLAIFSIILLVSVYSDKPIAVKQYFGIQTISWDQSQNSFQNGLLLSIITNIQWLSAETPSAYNKNSIDAIKDEIERREINDVEINPNIILVMSEAFWDPCVMENVSFSRDPVPFFHQLKKNYTFGSLLVPVFGGATVNTEFEVLTGNTMHFLPGGAIAYAQYVRRPMDSLASILSRQGYNSIAIHSYHNWFYRRNEVFKNLGFNKYISGEFFIDPVYKGDYIADSEVSKIIIEEIQNSEEPVFIYAVTMQNHGPYINKGDDSIKVEGELTQEAKNILEQYAQGMADADESLKMLVEHFENSSEPTIIAFFGDHLPALGEDYLVYKEAKYIRGEVNAGGLNYSEYIKIYSAPIVVWNNYNYEQEEINFNASYLGAYILNLANKQGSLYTDYLHYLSKQIPIFPKSNYCEQEGIKESELEDYKWLQHDLIFGEAYLYNDSSIQIIDEKYSLGRGELVINNITPTYEVIGKNFVPGMQVYINDKPQSAEYIDENRIKISTDLKNMGNENKLEIQLKVIDSMSRVIAQSNKIRIDKSFLK